MADLYPPAHSRSPQQYSYTRHTDSQQSPPYQSSSNGQMVYPPQLMSSQHSGSSNASSDENPNEPPSPSKSIPEHQPPKTESKPQATFLTKLYALLERPENHHMIRWDPAGEHIIVERPEQLALHVLPSIYRQSRFASFSRQLNIYGFMRKVNLRNVDPAIDDPDASTWSHPTLNRHSPPDVVANFKRRVPPRLPKPRKRDIQDQPPIPPPRSAIGLGSIPLTTPTNGPHKMASPPIPGRARGFSAPGSFTPLNQGGSTPWNGSSYRSALPPLTVPPDPPHISHPNSYHSSHSLHTPIDDAPSSGAFNIHSGSLSSLLNPSSSGYSRPAPTINTSYGSPFSSMPMQEQNSSVSPESRPTTGYSISSMSSLPYQEDLHEYSRPNSSHHRPNSPSRPQSSKSAFPPGSLSVRRDRRHSHAMSPYPSPYDHPDQRPSTSPQPVDEHQSSGIPRVRSMIQLPSADPYGFTPSQSEFAYSALPGAVNHANNMDSMNETNGWSHRNVRPSTSTSSISAASHTSSSQANTPPVSENYNGETDISRFSPDFGFVPMNEHIPQHYNKATGEI
ncbi:Heat shock factor protein 4 [Leucoagaricus sp. SymC.cos]|nr:Heat shock factor protein 4 [Leucoagaricus sp. SymC.cos]